VLQRQENNRPQDPEVLPAAELTMIHANQIAKEIKLDDGSRMVMLEMYDVSASVPDRAVENNIYRVSSDGTIRWQIAADSSAYPRTPFTGMGWSDDGELHCYRLEGTEFRIELVSGIATFIRLS
jgi:hypothetical protein